MDKKRILELVLQDPYLISMACYELIKSFEDALYRNPNDPDVEEWKRNIEYLEKLNNALKE